VSRNTGADNSTEDLKGKLMSEKNITNILKAITDKKSYLISWDDTTDLIKCVIDGYYFELKGYPYPHKSGSTSSSLYARVVKNTDNSELIKGDEKEGENNSFVGLEISNQAPETNRDAWLTLCENGRIPPESYVKFSSESLNIELKVLDSGELK
jgi:hypothetical protein